MKTKTCHVSNFGAFAPTEIQNVNGYVTYHDSRYYERAGKKKLQELAAPVPPSELTFKRRMVRNAAIVELADRAVAQWRKASA